MIPARRADPGITALEIGISLILVLGPFPFGAVQDPGRAVLEWGAIALLGAALVVTLSARGERVSFPPPRAAWCVAGLLLLAGLQAVPLGEATVRALSPAAAGLRDEVRSPPAIETAESAVLDRSAASFDPVPTLSLVPAATLSALRTGAALAAVWAVAFVVGVRGDPRRVAAAIVGSAAFQGCYGALVLFTGHDRIWNVPKKYFLDNATGTFVNRNHFAHVVALGTIVGVGWVIASAREREERDRRPQSWIHWFERDGLRHAGRIALVVASGAGLLLSFSRAGLALGAAGVGAAVVRTSSTRRGRRIVALLALAALAVVPLAKIGPERFVARYASLYDDVSDSRGRLRVWGDTVDIARDFPVVGSGFGTFEWVYPRFRSPEIRQLFVHAHNDPLQLTAEGGAIAFALLIGFLLAHARALRESWRGAYGPLGTALGLALVAGLLHACVDFPFHVPGAAIFPTAIAGLLLGRSCRARG